MGRSLYERRAPMKISKPITTAATLLFMGTTTLGAASPDEEFYTPGPDAPYEITATGDGWRIQLTPAVAAEAGVDANAAYCEGTYSLRQVGGTLEWGSQNTCSPGLPAGYAPQRIDVTLEGTCNDPWCIIWAPEGSGPTNSGWTYSRVATATATERCLSYSPRRFRLAVHLRYAGGGLDYGVARSSAYNGVTCDV